MSTLADFFSAVGETPDPLRDDLVTMIKTHANAAPRSLQKELGPSEISNPCMRRMAFGLMQVPRCNPAYDPLPSIFGTSIHAWLEGAAKAANERLGRERWLIETRVHVTAGLSGTSDLFDTDTGTVIDWKSLGVTSFMAQIKNPSPTYKGQIMLYGRGFRNAGHDVRQVAIAMLPRAGTLSKMHLWTVDYDDSVVDEILQRREQVIGLIDDLQVEANPERYQWIPAQEAGCLFCSWWKPNSDNPLQCPGAPA
jgi:hypothetical protein